MKSQLTALLFVLAVLVAEFLTDGLFSKDPYMNYTLGIGQQDLNEFTVCQWFYLGYTRSEMTFSLSYANYFDPNALILKFRYDDSNDTLILEMCKNQDSGVYPECIDVNFKDRIHQEWHHVCFVYKAVQYNDTAMETFMKSFHRGSLIQEGTYN